MDEQTTALLVVDVQNDFASREGSLYVAGAESAVPYINSAIEQALENGNAIFYTQDWHPAVTPHFARDGGVWPVHCVQDTVGAAFHADLKVVPGAPIIRKGTGGEDGYSAFTVRDPLSGDPTATELGRLLQEQGVKRVVIAGLATDYCVKESALDARQLGFEVTVLMQGIRPVDLRPGDWERALQAMREAGATLA